MSFQIELDPFDEEYALFIAKIRGAIRLTYEQEAESGLTQREMAETLTVDESVISKRLNGVQGNMTLRTLSDLYVAMGREPLSNFEAPLENFIFFKPIETSTIEGYIAHNPSNSPATVWEGISLDDFKMGVPYNLGASDFINRPLGGR